MNNGKPSLQELLADTVCKHCGQCFPSVRVPVIGQRAEQFAKWTTDLQKHIVKDHPEVIAQIIQTSMQFNGMLLMNQFKHADPQLNEEQDRTRHKVFKMCQRAVVSDATIDGKLTQLLLRYTIADNRGALKTDLSELVREMRDSLSEVGLYPDAPLITVPGSKPPS